MSSRDMLGTKGKNKPGAQPLCDPNMMLERQLKMAKRAETSPALFGKGGKGGESFGKRGGKGFGYQGTCWRCWRVGHKAAECMVNWIGEAAEKNEKEELVEEVTVNQ